MTESELDEGASSAHHFAHYSKKCSSIMYLEYTITASIYTKLFLRTHYVLRTPQAVTSYFAFSPC